MVSPSGTKWITPEKMTIKCCVCGRICHALLPPWRRSPNSSGWTWRETRLLAQNRSLQQFHPHTYTRSTCAAARSRTITYTGFQDFSVGLCGLYGLSCWWRSHVLPRSLRILINQLSVGRALVAAEKSDNSRCSPDASTKEWIAKSGRIEISLFDSIRKEAEDMENSNADGADHSSLAGERSITPKITTVQ